MKNKKFKSFLVELPVQDYRKLQKLVSSGCYRSKIEALRDMLRRFLDGF